jgi:hypothetical protein
VGGGGDTHAPDFDAWDRALRVNLGGVVNGTKIIVPPGLGAYQTAKFAVRGFTESLRMSLAPHEDFRETIFRICSGFKLTHWPPDNGGDVELSPGRVSVVPTNKQRLLPLTK